MTKNKDGSTTTAFPDGTWKIESKGYKAEKKPTNLVYTHAKSDVAYQNLVYKKGGMDNYQLNKEEVEELGEATKALQKQYDSHMNKYNAAPFGSDIAKHHEANALKVLDKIKVAKGVREEVEELDEVSIATLDSYRKKSFDEPGFKRQAGRALAFNKLSSHGDSKVKSSEEIDVAKSQIKDLIKPEHHSKYPISKITSMSHGRKIYRDASAAGHLIEEVELDELSKSTLGSYKDKANKNLNIANSILNTQRDSNMRDIATTVKNKRMSGIGKAADRLNKESIELDEAKKEPMEVYHTGYSAALQHAEKHLNKQGYDIHPDDWQQHISHGPSKPSEGKTVQLHVPLHKDGVKSKKVAHIQVYNRGNTIPKNNELNMYVN